MFAPSKAQLKASIPQAIRRHIRRLLSEHDSLPEWERRFANQHNAELQLAQEGWCRWKPTELLGLARNGPARRARNDASIALRELERENVLQTFQYEGTGRVYAVRLATEIDPKS